MPALLVLSVVVLAVGCQHSLHDAAHFIILHFDQQMKVIGHQAICVEIERELSFLLSDNVREPEIVIV